MKFACVVLLAFAACAFALPESEEPVDLDTQVQTDMTTVELEEAAAEQSRRHNPRAGKRHPTPATKETAKAVKEEKKVTAEAKAAVQLVRKAEDEQLVRNPNAAKDAEKAKQLADKAVKDAKTAEKSAKKAQKDAKVEEKKAKKAEKKAEEKVMRVQKEEQRVEKAEKKAKDVAAKDAKIAAQTSNPLKVVKAEKAEEKAKQAIIRDQKVEKVLKADEAKAKQQVVAAKTVVAQDKKDVQVTAAAAVGAAKITKVAESVAQSAKDVKVAATSDQKKMTPIVSKADVQPAAVAKPKAPATKTYKHAELAQIEKLLIGLKAKLQAEAKAESTSLQKERDNLEKLIGEEKALKKSYDSKAALAKKDHASVKREVQLINKLLKTIAHWAK